MLASWVDMEINHESGTNSSLASASESDSVEGSEDLSVLFSTIKNQLVQLDSILKRIEVPENDN